MFPLHRGRRLRTNESIRSLVRETTLVRQILCFQCSLQKEKIKVEIVPGIFRRSIDLEEIKETILLGIRAVNIYVK
jgi:porphobilinogen synthase